MFPDKKLGTFLLPLKKQVRQHLGCAVGDTLQIEIRPNGHTAVLMFLGWGIWHSIASLL